MNIPILVFVVSLVVLWLSGRIGAFVHSRFGILGQDEQDDLNLVVAAALTLLGLIIGFTFSMAVTRYDQRKNYEAEEANAIGTEYVRADLLPGASAERVRELLKRYLDQRVLFYTTRNSSTLQQINASTVQLQNDLWSAIREPATVQPTPVVALAVSGMNDVLNSQAYTHAAWWNRIPIAAWALMGAIAICCNLLLGYNLHRVERETYLLFVLPFIVSIAFFLIAEIDSPVGGFIRVHPQNLITVSHSLNASNTESLKSSSNKPFGRN